MWARSVKTLDSTFTKQVSCRMRDDSLWANVGKIWLFQGPFSAISCSWNLLVPRARSLWSTVACRWIPSSPFKTSMLWTGPAKPWWAKIPKIIILGYGKGDSCQISPIQNVNSLLSTTSSSFWEDPAKFMSTRLWLPTCLALGKLSLQLATCHSQTNPPSMNKWLSTLRHPAQARHDVPVKNRALMGCLGGGGSYETSEVGVAFAWIHIDLVTLVSLWGHCHLLSAQLQTPHFLVRLAVNSARHTLP